MLSNKNILVNLLVSVILLFLTVFAFESKRERLYIEITDIHDELFKDYSQPFACSYNVDDIQLKNLLPFSEIPDRLKNNSFDELSNKGGYFLASPTWFSKVVVVNGGLNNIFFVETFTCDIISTSISPNVLTYYPSDKLQILEDKLKEKVKSFFLYPNIVVDKNGEVDYSRIQDSDKAINNLLKAFSNSNKYYFFKSEKMPKSYNSMVFLGGTINGKYGCLTSRFPTFKNYYGYTYERLDYYYLENVKRYSPQLDWKAYLFDIGKYFGMSLIIQILINILIAIIKNKKINNN